jgi:hypothetical protein
MGHVEAHCGTFLLRLSCSVSAFAATERRQRRSELSVSTGTASYYARRIVVMSELEIGLKMIAALSEGK